MSGNPWSKFFWSDWETDPALRLCSLAAQGLWMRCLCIAAKSDPTGYVAVNGRPLDATDLARLTGVAEPEVATLLAELDRNGVFSRDRTGRIYSRRMVRDVKKAQAARKNGQKGGNPTLSKKRVIGASDNPPVKGRDKPQKPEARSQYQKEEPDLPSGDTPLRRPPERLNGLRLPEDWTPSAEQRLYAADHGYSPGEIEAMAEDFRDYWLARSGADARKRDWNRTWRRWVRNQQNFRGGRSNGAKPARTVESDRAAILRGLRLDTAGRSLDGDYPGYSGEAFHRH